MAFHLNSKADTLFLSDASVDDLFVDQSQYHASLDDQGTYANSSDDRFGVASPRELAMVVQLTNTDSGVLMYFGNDAGTAFTYRIEVISNTVRFFHNSSGTPLATLSPPNLAASETNYVIHWSTCRDYVTSNWLSEFAIGNLSNATWVIARAVHSSPSVNNSHRFSVAALPAGGTPFTGLLDDVQKCRVSSRFHSVTEAKEDWQSLSTPPVPTNLYFAPEAFPFCSAPYDPDLAEDVGVALTDDYAFAGPDYYLGAGQSPKQRLRLQSPIINQGIRTPVTLDRNPVTDSRFALSPDGDGYLLSIHHLWWRPVPPLANLAKVRIFAQTWLQAGSPGGSSVSVSFRLYSMNKLPHEAGLKYSVSSTGTRTTNDTSTGLGAWIDLGTVLLVNDVYSLTYLALGFKVGAPVGADYNALRVKGITVEPLVTEE
ncbi:hypothetical protein OV203_25995 [Nannocystis sp. ILAH1]|uniref:hypothetical protein n=1 Tax=Nannocystis sp. ILAH1 TaxID=2996789 RepID=UPI002271DA37|nr:hypothetical protein [Nannocystis sp. ILAH1]MCY0990622.1 hypothetical protein [Nannocystis sp. ILAH1]